MYRSPRALRFAAFPALVIAFVMMSASIGNAATAVAIWHMGSLGADGHTMHDASSAGNHGTTTDVTVSTSGFDGYSYSFNGTSSKVTVPDAPSLDPGSNPLTVILRVNFTAVPAGSGDYDLIQKGRATRPFYRVEIRPSGSAACLFRGSAGHSSVTLADPLNDGAWHTIRCEKASGSISITVDGTTRSKNATIGAISNAKALTVGSKLAGGDKYQGLLDEVTIKIG